MTFTIDGEEYYVEEITADNPVDATRFRIFTPSYLCSLMLEIDGNGIPYWRAMDANIDNNLVEKLGRAIEAYDS